jgi:hypothetical protein
VEDGAPDAVGGALDVIDRSIGMYVLRRLTGRGTRKPDEPDSAVVLSADQVAYRIGAAGAAPAAAAGAAPGATPSPAEAPDSHTPLARATRAPRPAAGAPRERLVRDSGAALLALATIGLVAVVIWPHGPSGQPEQSIFGVDGTVVTPGPTGEVEAATAEATTDASGEPQTAPPTSEATAPVLTRATAAVGQPAPKLPPGTTPRPTSRLAPTPRPTAAPTASATAGATPSPEATPSPTPEPTATPTPTPTPTPAPPDPTPSP